MRRLVGARFRSARFILGIDVNPYKLIVAAMLFRYGMQCFIRVGQDVEKVVRAHYAEKILHAQQLENERKELQYLRWVVTGEPQRIARGLGPFPLQ
jgi:hypothetical protein